MATKKNDEYLTYKGRPVVRSGDKIYYGSMADNFVVEMTIQTKKMIQGEEIADKILIRMMNTDPTVKPEEVITKTSEKNGFSAAMDIATVWLDRANPKEKAETKEKAPKDKASKEKAKPKA